MTTRKFYADTTALISLARIDQLDLLIVLASPILVTVQVWREAVGDPEKPGVAALYEARQHGRLAIVEEGDPNAFPNLDPGESTVFSAAIATQAAVLVDERQARSWIERNPEIRAQLSHVSGVIGLLLVAKRTHHIEAVRPLLDAFTLQSFRVSQRLYEETLRDAGEL